MPQHKRGPWSQSEDQYLLHLVSVHGAHNWVRISSTIQTRSPKQCRERFHQNLKPNLNHDPITPEEGLLIEQMVAEMGKRWAEIARRLRGRSDNAVKNWWNGGMNRRRRGNNSRRTEMEVVGQQSQSNTLPRGDVIPPQLPSHHHTLPPHFAQAAMQQINHNVTVAPQPQHFFGHPMFHPGNMGHTNASHISVPSSAQFYRHPSGIFETPLPSPSTYSQMSEGGAPSLISDCSSISTRSPHDGTSPIELPPLSGSRDERRHSSAPMLRLGVPGSFVTDGSFHGAPMQMKQMLHHHQQPMLQEAFLPQQHQQFHHPAPYLPSQPRHPSPLQQAVMIPQQQLPRQQFPPHLQQQLQQQQYQNASRVVQRRVSSFHPPQPSLPSTPTQLPGISKLSKSGDAKQNHAVSGTGIPIDPAIDVSSPPATPEGSPKDKMSLSNLTH